MNFRCQDETYERNNIAYFSQVWNEFINSMREEDLISNRFKLLAWYFLHCMPGPEFQAFDYIFNSLSRDRDLLLVPYSASYVSVIQWPPFLLASKVCHMSGYLWPEVYYDWMNVSFCFISKNFQFDRFLLLLTWQKIIRRRLMMICSER